MEISTAKVRIAVSASVVAVGRSVATARQLDPTEPIAHSPGLGTAVLVTAERGDCFPDDHSLFIHRHHSWRLSMNTESFRTDLTDYILSGHACYHREDPFPI